MGIESVATSVERTLSGAERLSWKEICERYPDAWVTLVWMEYENDDRYAGELLSAVVVNHSESRRGCMVEARPILEREGIRSAWHRYTGEVAEALLPLRWL